MNNLKYFLCALGLSFCCSMAYAMQLENQEGNVEGIITGVVALNVAGNQTAVDDLPNYEDLRKELSRKKTKKTKRAPSIDANAKNIPQRPAGTQIVADEVHQNFLEEKKKKKNVHSEFEKELQQRAAGLAQGKNKKTKSKHAKSLSRFSLGSIGEE